MKKKLYHHSTDTEKAFNKIQHHFMLETLSKRCIEGIFYHTIKAIYEKSYTSIILNVEKLEAFPLRLRNRKGCSLSPLLFSVVLEVVTRLKELIRGCKSLAKQQDTK